MKPIFCCCFVCKRLKHVSKLELFLLALDQHHNRVEQSIIGMVLFFHDELPFIKAASRPLSVRTRNILHDHRGQQSQLSVSQCLDCTV